MVPCCGGKNAGFTCGAGGTTGWPGGGTPGGGCVGGIPVTHKKRNASYHL